MDHLTQLQTTLTKDPARLRVLQLVRTLGLPDCWVGAGFVRSAIWDLQHDRNHSPLPPDIDVIWFDETQNRIRSKNWPATWPNLFIVDV
jgi:hypothetical protein